MDCNWEATGLHRLTRFLGDAQQGIFLFNLICGILHTDCGAGCVKSGVKLA